MKRKVSNVLLLLSFILIVFFGFNNSSSGQTYICGDYCSFGEYTAIPTAWYCDCPVNIDLMDCYCEYDVN